MPHWRKATWAISVWNALMILLFVTAIGAIISHNCAGQVGDALAACQEGSAMGAGIGIPFIVIIWFIGFIVLGLVWLMSRPKENVVVYGPQGQQVMLSEKEAKRRVASPGWSYTPR